MTAQALLVAPGHPRSGALRELLQECGYTVRTGDVAAAAAAAEALDLVVLALDPDGVASAALCAQLPCRQVPVAIVVGDPGPADLLRLLSSGAAACVSERLSDKELRTHLNALSDWRVADPMRLDVAVDLHADRRERVQELLDWVADGDGDLASARFVDRLVEGDRRAALGRVTEAVAHDFNNLLTVITGRARLVLDRYWGDDATRAQLTEVLAAAEAATALSRKLLAIGRPWDMGRRCLELDIFLEELRDVLAEAAPDGARVALAELPPDCRVDTDPSKLEQVVLSLGLNALDAVSEGGTVTLGASLCTLRGTSAVAISVADDGPGMDPEVLARACEPFFSTRGRTGLGLATARQVTASLEGELALQSRPGAGTTVHVRLPASAEAAEDPDSVRPATGRARVLVVEDEESVRSLIAAVLDRAGFLVRSAATAEEALALEGEVDLLVTDLTLAGLSGSALAARLRQSHPGLRVLTISGHTGAAVTGSGVDVEAREFLQKPFTPDILLERVQRLLSRR